MPETHLVRLPLRLCVRPALALSACLGGSDPGQGDGEGLLRAPVEGTPGEACAPSVS
jgi:hypothetical protein